MTAHINLFKSAVVALIFSPIVVQAFHLPRQGLFGLPVPKNCNSKAVPSARNLASTSDFDLPPGLEVKETYEQGSVPLYNVVNATIGTSQLIYSFAAMKLDIKENLDLWIDGEDMLKDGILLEEEIAGFVTKNRERILGLDQTTIPEMIRFEKGLKGDNRVRCVDVEYANDELVYGIFVNRCVVSICF